MRLHLLGGLKNHEAAHAPSTEGDRARHAASRGGSAVRVVTHRRLLYGQPFLKVDRLDFSPGQGGAVVTEVNVFDPNVASYLDAN